MKFKGLDYKEYTTDLRFTKFGFKPNSRSKSNIQNDCGKLLSQAFPHDPLLQEVPITVEKGTTLYLDFFIPNKKIVIEIHGEQHDKYNEFFHGSEEGFKHSLHRDAMKKQWCEMNNIELYVIRSIAELKELL